MINKDTKLFGSFSKKPGNRGCSIFNAAFDYHQINAIYKSYQIEDIADAVLAARTLNFGGFAVSMPFKKEVLKHVDETAETSKICLAANTVVNMDGKLVAHNTDFLSAKEFLSTVAVSVENKVKTSKDLVLEDKHPFFVLGNGGYANAVTKALLSLKIDYIQITRDSWEHIQDIRSAVVYNCTPVENIKLDESSFLIDCITSTPTGRKLGIMQAMHQYFLYTGKQLPFNYDA